MKILLEYSILAGIALVAVGLALILNASMTRRRYYYYVNSRFKRKRRKKLEKVLGIIALLVGALTIFATMLYRA